MKWTIVLALSHVRLETALADSDILALPVVVCIVLLENIVPLPQCSWSHLHASAYDNIVAFPVRFVFCYVTNWPIQEALNREWFVIAASSKTTGRVSTTGPSSETARISPFSLFTVLPGLFFLLPSVAFKLTIYMIRARSWETFIAINATISH
jgi:hypothetical protein